MRGVSSFRLVVVVDVVDSVVVFAVVAAVVVVDVVDAFVVFAVVAAVVVVDVVDAVVGAVVGAVVVLADVDAVVVVLDCRRTGGCSLFSRELHFWTGLVHMFELRSFRCLLVARSARRLAVGVF